MNICHIMGAGDPAGARIDAQPGDIIIAADAGYLELARRGIRPDLVVGDFDSLGDPPADVEILRYPPMKDDTDMLIAVRAGLARGFARFLLYGALGGRIDHTLANLQTLLFIAEQGARGALVGADESVAAVRNGEIAFPAHARGTISVFCMGEAAKGVTLEGLLFPLENHTLNPSYPIGVSNAFTDAPARVRVREGALLVVFPTAAMPSIR
ncbi:MAG: thiamine diphosphokinase [Christensenellales bacterium]|jgi:thiamine pyrophosphokinase